MNIYTIDLDSLHKLTSKKISDGDFIFLCEDNSITLYTVNNNSETLDIDNGTLLKLDSTNKNTLEPSLYSKGKQIFIFDGRTRKGNIDILSKLKDSFNHAATKSFIQDAIKITTYNADNWSLKTFENLFKRDRKDDTISEIFAEPAESFAPEEQKIIYVKPLHFKEKKTTKTKKSSNKSRVYSNTYKSYTDKQVNKVPKDFFLFQYLTEQQQALWVDEYHKKINLEKIFEHIRALNLNAFLKAVTALHKFHGKSCSIYSTIDRNIQL